MAQSTRTSVALALLLVSRASFASPLSNIPAEPLKVYKDLILKRDPPKALAGSSTDAERRFQPALDFDKDGCYNTPAVGPDGKVAEGLDHNNTGGGDQCRDASDLDNNNVYVRTRCNNGWCTHVYDYYFEKDVAVQHVANVGGHRHDWEHIIVFAQGDEAKIVAASKHGDYDTQDAGKIRWDGSHPKVVYHKDGGMTHCFRFGTEKDDMVENHKGVWFRGTLVNWEGLKTAGVRDNLAKHDFGSASMAIKDENMKVTIDHARNGGAPGFDSGKDS